MLSCEPASDAELAEALAAAELAEALAAEPDALVADLLAAEPELDEVQPNNTPPAIAMLARPASFSAERLE